MASSNCKLVRSKIVRSMLPFLTLLTVINTSGALHSQTPNPTVIVLVRHADVKPPSGDNQELSDKGTQRAKDLATRLKDRGVQFIFVSEIKRTKKTAAPLSQTQNPPIPFEPYTRGKPDKVQGNAVALADKIRSQFKGKKVLVVSHSEMLPAIIKRLVKGASPPITNIPTVASGEFNKMFVVTIQPNGKITLFSGTYGA